jgi:hypothetical protein
MITERIRVAASGYGVPSGDVANIVELTPGVVYEIRRANGVIVTLTDTGPSIEISITSKYDESLSLFDTTQGTGADAGIDADVDALALLHGSVSRAEMKRRILRGELDQLKADGVI